jgi:hypothetical protein
MITGAIPYALFTGSFSVPVTHTGNVVIQQSGENRMPQDIRRKEALEKND